MGKLTSFAAGAGQGYLAASRYQDTKDRNKTQDELLKAVLLGKDKGKSDDLELLSGGGDEVMPLNRLAPLTDEEKASRAKEYGMADGGMVQPMPIHHDNMSWQRQSFKK